LQTLAYVSRDFALKMSSALVFFEQFNYYQLLNKECLIAVSKLYPFLCFQLIFEHFGETA